ncbi:helix-turn-helix transcriptional regulator [Falsigemmobacter intermedius]|uniref:helix-turn-helix transcriptional regulator n=1 Tax=Falsigemmobacter intermedius TaxID=1553448 RepID=UPI003F07D1D5
MSAEKPVRRTDRLYDLIQILRDGRLHRASEMADRLQVSTRTIWRDMATLMASGLPVEGERGIGYVLRAPITLPPMILSGDEIEALRLGVRLVAQGDDPALARAARSLAGKFASVTPAPGNPEDDELFGVSARASERAPVHLPLLREAIRNRERVTITYIEADGSESHQDIRPLEMDLTSRVWTLTAWCEHRAGFRSLRIDRIVALTGTDETFPREPGRELADFHARETALPDEP